MTLIDFVLARISEEESSWHYLAARPGYAASAQAGLAWCAEKRRMAEAYRTWSSRALREELAEFAVVYDDHPDYEPVWAPIKVW